MCECAQFLKWNEIKKLDPMNETFIDPSLVILKNAFWIAINGEFLKGACLPSFNHTVRTRARRWCWRATVLTPSAPNGNRLLPLEFWCRDAAACTVIKFFWCPLCAFWCAHSWIIESSHGPYAATASERVIKMRFVFVFVPAPREQLRCLSFLTVL